MKAPISSGIPAEVLRDLPDSVHAAALEEQRSADERALREAADRRSDAQIIDAERAKKQAQLAAYIQRTAPNLDLCDACGKSRSAEILPPRYRGRFDSGSVAPHTHCACPGGIVANADAWEVEFVRGYRDAAAVILRPAAGGFTPIPLHAQVAPGDTEPVGPARFIPAARAFEWGEESPACRRLAYTMLCLVTSPTVADRWAEAYMREVLATTIAKNAGRKQSQTVGEIRAWLASHEAAEGAAA